MIRVAGGEAVKGLADQLRCDLGTVGADEDGLLHAFGESFGKGPVHAAAEVSLAVRAIRHTPAEARRHPLRVASLEPDLHRHGTTNGHQRAPCVAWSVGRSVPRGEFLHPGERVPGHLTLHFGRARGTQRRDEPGLRFPGLGVTRKDGESSLHRVYSGRKASSLQWEG